MSDGMHNRASAARDRMVARLGIGDDAHRTAKTHAAVLAVEIEGMDRAAGYDASDVASLVEKSILAAFEAGAERARAKVRAALLASLGL